MKRIIQQITLTCLFCLGLQSIAQAPTGAASVPGAIADPFVMTWKPNGPGCDDRYENGLEEKGLFTNQASLIVFLIPDSGKLAVSVYVENPAEGAGRIDVNRENFHLLKVTDKGLSELKRAEAIKMAKSMERRSRIANALAAGASSFGAETTATGTATYSDGTTANYSVTMPNPQAQSDAINRAQANIGRTQSRGDYLVGEELKRTTLDPGQHTMGRLFFPEQKGGENLLVRADIGNVRYEIPFHLPGKHEAKVAPSATQKEDSRPPQRAAATTFDADQQTMPTDPVQQAAWYRKAAERGDALAQSKLGWLCATGRGVPQDYAQAAIWFRKAAEQGDAGAQFNLGLSYAKGQGVLQDYEQASLWYRKAADKGDAGAQFSLGSLYYHGRGVPQDYAQAALWIRKAADQGIVRAQSMLGELYYYGRGVPQDYVQVAAWTLKAADQGYAPAQDNLGELYENGKGFPQDYAQAAAWYRKAADQGNAVAQFDLGSLYSTGRGVSQDYSEAYFWLNLAAAGIKGKDQEKYSKARDEAAAKLDTVAITSVQQRAANWLSAHPARP